MGFPHSIIGDQYDLLKRTANYRIAQNFDVLVLSNQTVKIKPIKLLRHYSVYIKRQ